MGSAVHEGKKTTCCGVLEVVGNVEEAEESIGDKVGYWNGTSHTTRWFLCKRRPKADTA